jgi:hypothetical protein
VQPVSGWVSPLKAGESVQLSATAVPKRHHRGDLAILERIGLERPRLGVEEAPLDLDDEEGVLIAGVECIVLAR